MGDRSRRLLALACVVAFGLLLAGHHAGAQTLDAQSPPPALVSGLEPPAAPNDQPPMFPVDSAEPAFLEYFADDRTPPVQPASPSGSATSGSVLASDNFSNPSAGLLPAGTSRPDRFKLGYGSGEYQIASVSSGMDISETALIGGNYGDISIAVDARVVENPSATPDETVRIYCRRQTQGSGFTGYRFQFSPLLDGWALYRGDGDTGVSLSGVQFIAGPPMAADSHHLVLTCAGSTISASIDGAAVGTFHDGSYRDGRAALGFGNFTRQDLSGFFAPGTAYPGSYDVRFSRLVLTAP